MAESYEEKRRYKRIYFTKEDGVRGVFLFPVRDGISYPATILDLSESGLCFSLHKGEMAGLRVGDRLALEEMQGPEKLQFRSEITMEVRWLLDHESLRHRAVGCEFMTIEGMVREKIRSTVQSGTIK